MIFIDYGVDLRKGFYIRDRTQFIKYSKILPAHKLELLTSSSFFRFFSGVPFKSTSEDTWQTHLTRFRDSLRYREQPPKTFLELFYFQYFAFIVIVEQMTEAAMKDKEEKHAKGMMDAQAVKV